MSSNKEYYIVSLKWSKGDNICFWRPNASGYTEYINDAGLYSEQTVKNSPDYYNDGIDTLAVEKSQLNELFKKNTICLWNSAKIATLIETLKQVQSDKEGVPA